MTDKLFDTKPSLPLTGLHEGETLLINDSLRGLTGTFVTTIVVDGLPMRYRVTVTDPGGAGFEVSAPVSDWWHRWRKVE